MGYAVTSVHQGVRITAHQLRQFLINAHNFLLFADNCFLQIIVQIHKAHRFDIQRRPRRRPVMNQAFKGVAIFLLNRDNVTIVTLRYDGFLEVFLIVAIVQNSLQIRFNLFTGAHNRSTQLL